MNLFVIFCSLFFNLDFLSTDSFFPSTSKSHYLKNPLTDHQKMMTPIHLDDLLRISSPSLLVQKPGFEKKKKTLKVDNKTGILVYINDAGNSSHSNKEKKKKPKYLIKWKWEFPLIIIFILSALTFLKAQEKFKKEISIIMNEKIVLENKKNTLEEDILFQKEKIKELQQKLNLKIETEKAILEDLKKIKKTNCVKSQQETLKDLFVKANNFMNIDKKSQNISFECDTKNQEFLMKLKTLYPTLTNRELKLCIYFRMGLSSKEISILENITTGTIRVYKTRIKNKIILDKETKLSHYLLNIE